MQTPPPLNPQGVTGIFLLRWLFCGPQLHSLASSYQQTVANTVAVCFSQLHRPARGPLETVGHIHPCRSVDRVINQSRHHLHATWIIAVFTLCVCVCV